MRVYPKAVSVGNSVDLREVTSVCLATQELYNYKTWVFDLLKAEDICRQNGLRGFEIEAATDVMEKRFDSWTLRLRK